MVHPPLASQVRQQNPPATLGDVLYAKAKSPLPEQDWASLLRSVAAGDQHALHALYEMSHRIVFTLMMRMTANLDIAEELTIEVFHEVWRNASRYDPDARTVLAWIMNQARARAVERLGDRSADGAGKERPVAAADPRDLQVLRRQTESLHAALAMLSVDERQALEATFLAGQTHAEAAARLNQPHGAVRARLRSGLHKLRDALNAEAARA